MACREIGCWQHECELGITDVSQRPPIFWQHSRCSTLISAAGVKQAESGNPTITTINVTATNCAGLCKITIIPRPVNSARTEFYEGCLRATSGKCLACCQQNTLAAVETFFPDSGKILPPSLDYSQNCWCTLCKCLCQNHVRVL